MKSLTYFLILFISISNLTYAYDPIKTRIVNRHPNDAPLRQIDISREVQIPRQQKIQVIKNLTE